MFKKDIPTFSTLIPYMQRDNPHAYYSLILFCVFVFVPFYFDYQNLTFVYQDIHLLTYILYLAIPT